MSIGKLARTASVALLLVGFASPVAFGQLREQPELLRRLWPFGRSTRPVVLLPPEQLAQREQPDKRERPLVAPFVPMKVDINNCTLEQLQNLPGVSASMGAHLMAGRPYRNFQDLERMGIPQNVVQGLNGVIVFGP